ncbi:hypothetical protein D3C80_1694050 [compost metagenome]
MHFHVQHHAAFRCTDHHSGEPITQRRFFFLQVEHLGLNVGEFLGHIGIEFLLQLHNLQFGLADLQLGLGDARLVIGHFSLQHVELALLLQQTLVVDKAFSQQLFQLLDFT